MKMWRIVNTLSRRPATFQSVASVRPASTSQSDIHTDRLYPGTSSNDRFKPVPPPEQDLQSLHFNGYIPVTEVQIRSMPGSSGPGGQNVNKSATKVEIRFNVEKANWLSDPIKQVLLEKWSPSQLNKEGEFIVKSDRTRSQFLNQADALSKLRYAITNELEGVRTRLEDQQLSQEETEKELKRAQRAAALRIKEKRQKSLNHQARKNKSVDF